MAGPWWGSAARLARRSCPAVESFRRLIALRPDHGMALHNLGKSLFELGQVDPALEAFHRSLNHFLRKSMSGAGQHRGRHSRSPSRGQPRHSRGEAGLGTSCLSPAAARRCFEGRSPVPGRPIRLGYVSAFFGKRNWMKPVWGLINHHDRDRFEVHLFSDGPESAIGNQSHKIPRDRFHDVKGLSNSALAHLIEELEIDLLIDLNGYSRPSRLPLFAAARTRAGCLVQHVRHIRAWQLRLLGR